MKWHLVSYPGPRAYSGALPREDAERAAAAIIASPKVDNLHVRECRGEHCADCHRYALGGVV